MKSLCLQFIFILILPLAVWSQDEANLAIAGTVKDIDGGRLENVTVNLFQDGKLINKVQTGRNGKFDLYLDYNFEFIIEFQKSGFISKRISVNTNSVPEEDQMWGFEFGTISIDLFKDIDGVDFSDLEDPVAKIYFKPGENFTIDNLYQREMDKKVERIEQAYENRQIQLERQARQLEEDFEMAMRDGQLALEAKDFLTAKENFIAATNLKPEATEPKKMVEQVEQAIEKESGVEEKYMAKLASADDLFREEKFAEAKQAYKEALSIKPNESYPQEQIKASDQGIAKLADARKEEEKQQEIETQYQNAIASGDKELASQNLDAARRWYKDASVLKPTESYPKEQIAKIDEQIAEVEAEKAKEAEKKALNVKYSNVLAKADRLLKEEVYTEAVNVYLEALAIKPDETYPQEQIDKIKEIKAKMAEEQKQFEKDQKYNEIIAEGDRLFNELKLDEAEAAFNKALEVNPDAPYPNDQLKRIQSEREAIASRQKKQQEESERRAEYDELISAADIALTAKDFDEAETKYKAAIEVYPEEQYPKNQLATISKERLEKQKLEERQAEREAKEEEYTSIISDADRLFKEEKYNEASSAYNSALKLKPNEVYPKTQLDVIELRLRAIEKDNQQAASTAETQRKYEAAIQSADRAFNEDNLDLAEENYRLAASIKSDEVYPDAQIEKIEEKRKKLEEQKQLEQDRNAKRSEYDNAIAQADKLFETNKLNEAKFMYGKAQSILPDENYPKERIELIDKELEKRESDQLERDRMSELNKKYDEQITLGDQQLKANQLEDARESYRVALGIKSDEVYPKNQIAKIESLIKQREQELARKEEYKRRYDSWMQKGENAIMAKNWQDARTAFQEALKLFPDNSEPKEKLTEVNNLEDRENEVDRKEKFDKLVAEADRDFLQQRFEDARDKYNQSLKYFPNAEHPKDRISRIDKILADLAEKDYKPEDIDKEKTIVEESFMDGNRKVTIRRVTIGDQTEEYKRVIHPWGGKYYFLNGESISELVWNRETTPK